MADENVVASKNAEAVRLAQKHYQIEEGITDIIRINDRIEVEVVRTEPIKLLEVNQNTVPSGIMPLYFGPAPDFGILYPSTIVEVTPAEYEQIKIGSLRLPNGWKLGETIPKPAMSP